MNTTKLTLTLVIVAATTAALMIAPALTGTVEARKIATCKNGNSDVDCTDTTAGTPAGRKDCTAGNGGGDPNCSGAKSP